MTLGMALKVLANPNKYSELHYKEACRVYARSCELVLCHVCQESRISRNLADQGLPCLACTRWLRTDIHNDIVKKPHA